MIQVEVVYADTPQQQHLVNVTVLPNATIEDAIIASNVLQHYEKINLQQTTVGIFGKTAQLTTRLNAGDRVEIYRSLKIDPKEARRQRSRS